MKDANLIEEKKVCIKYAVSSYHDKNVHVFFINLIFRTVLWGRFISSSQTENWDKKEKPINNLTCCRVRIGMGS